MPQSRHTNKDTNTGIISNKAQRPTTYTSKPASPPEFLRRLSPDVFQAPRVPLRQQQDPLLLRPSRGSTPKVLTSRARLGDLAVASVTLIPPHGLPPIFSRLTWDYLLTFPNQRLTCFKPRRKCEDTGKPLRKPLQSVSGAAATTSGAVAGSGLENTDKDIMLSSHGEGLLMR